MEPNHGIHDRGYHKRTEKKWREPAEKLLAEIASESISEGLKSEKSRAPPQTSPSMRASHATYTGPAINLARPLVNCFRPASVLL